MRRKNQKLWRGWPIRHHVHVRGSALPPVALVLLPVSPRAEGVIAFAFRFLSDFYSPPSLPPRFSPGKRKKKYNPNPSPESTDPRPRRGPRLHRCRAPAAAGHRTARRHPSRPSAAAGGQGCKLAHITHQ